MLRNLIIIIETVWMGFNRYPLYNEWINWISRPGIMFIKKFPRNDQARVMIAIAFNYSFNYLLLI